MHRCGGEADKALKAVAALPQNIESHLWVIEQMDLVVKNIHVCVGSRKGEEATRQVEDVRVKSTRVQKAWHEKTETACPVHPNDWKYSDCSA